MIVVDASVIANALADDGPVGDACRSAMPPDGHLVAPDHLHVEVMSVLRGRWLGGKLSEPRATACAEALHELTIQVVPLRATWRRVWALRGTLTPYDAAYVAVAELMSAPLVTADRRLARAAGALVDIRTLP